MFEIFLPVRFTQGCWGLLGLSLIILNSYEMDHSLIPYVKRMKVEWKGVGKSQLPALLHDLHLLNLLAMRADGVRILSGFLR